MTWAKQIDRTKFPRNTYVIVGWNKPNRKWFAAMCRDDDTDGENANALAVGQGNDPVEAMIALAVDAGALAETGEWLP